MDKKSLERKLMIGLLSINLLVTGVFSIAPKVSAATGCFPDAAGHWAEEFICWLSDSGIAGGYPDGTFRPEETVTRAEMAVMLKNLADGYESRIAELEATLASVSLENGGDDFVFTGVNIHLRDGSGDTGGTPTGLGNLIVGYNEDQGSDASRTGSHNLVLGEENQYTNYGGLVAGRANSINASFATICGGSDNQANGYASSISTGRYNVTSANYSGVAGGMYNTASGGAASVNGGAYNEASGSSSSISGGYMGSVTGNYDWLAGTLFEDH